MNTTRSLKSMYLGAANRSRLSRAVTAFVGARDTYLYLKRRFIRNGQASPVDETARAEMVSRFEAIDRGVPIGTTPTDGLILAELLINCKGTGDVVECGCYAGGSTAKLSIVARALGRRLFVFDSFEGLPAVDNYNLRDQHIRRSESWVTDWKAGRYTGELEDVKGNVERFGEPSLCTYIKGWFSETLHADNLPAEVGFAFTDVDIASSARDCLVGIWPHLTELGIFVSHDAAWVKVLQAFHDRKLWEEELESFPPIFFGAGFGIYDASPHIGYFVKGEDVPAGYLKEITLDK